MLFASLAASRTRSRAHHLAVVAGAALLVWAAPLGAQDPGAMQGFVTRAELERQAASAEPAEAAAIRDRLRDGDFRVGDRVVITTRSTVTLPGPVAQALNDTLIVREGRTLRIPNVADFSLAGILRSEVEERLNAHLKGYLRSVDVRVETLVQANISGPVGRPGYTVLAPDMLVTDAIMAGGGIARDADVNRTQIKRDGETVVGSDSLRVAIQRGATLDQIDFQSGDELAVGERRNINWRTILGAVSAVASVTFLIMRISR